MTSVVTPLTVLLVDEIAERVRWLVDNRADGNARALARKAKLPSETHVGLILERGGARTAATVLAKVAEAGGVRLDWLVKGEEPRDLTEVPDSYQVVYDVRYPNLHKALTRPPIETVDPRTVRRALSRTNASNTDLTVEQWLRWIINEDESVRLGLTDEGNVPGSEIAAIKAKGEAEHPDLPPPPPKWPGGKRPKK